MAQMRGPGSYGIGAPTAFGGPAEDKSDQSPLDAIRQQTNKIEDMLDTLSEPIKPCVPQLLLEQLPKRRDGISLTCFSLCNSYLPAIGRFLIVVTFIEDALRIITQWNDQLLYLHDYRHSTPPP